MATIEQQGTPVAVGRRLNVGWALGTIVVIAIGAVVVASISFLSEGTRADNTSAVTRQASLYTPDELAVLRLVQQGVLPDGVIALEPFRTKALVNQGLVPRAAVMPAPVPAAPLYCADELAVMAAVASGAIPSQALDGHAFLMKRLVNQGLIPRQSVPLC